MSAHPPKIEKHLSRLELERLHREFLKEKFPVVDCGEELDDLHDALIAYGADVVAAVEKVVRAARSYIERTIQ